MTLLERIDADLKDAMRAGETRKRDVIRFLRAAIKNAEIEKRGTLDDAGVEQIIRTQVKQRRDSIDLFRQGHRDDLADEEQLQVDILMDYLPQQMDEADLAALVTQVADELGVTSMRDMGKLMPALQAAVAGRAEGRTVSALAKAELERRAAAGA